LLVLGFPLSAFRDFPFGSLQYFVYLCNVELKNMMIMKKLMVMSVGSLLLLSSCGTYTATGAATGGYFGSIIGSAIGGISGGWRGSDIGSLVGMAGGAAVGAAIGAAADNAEQRRYEEYRERRMQDRTAREQRQPTYQQDRQYDDNNDSGFDPTNSGDDRLYGFGSDFGAAPEAHQSLEIRHPKIVDASRDGVLKRGEEARVVFEVYNNSSKPVFKVQPTVAELTGNKHIHISENIMVESIMPGKGIRYTASIKADNGLRDGEAVIRIGVVQANKEVSSQSREFTIKTSKR
jgi:hypothetical protein